MRFLCLFVTSQPVLSKNQINQMEFRDNILISPLVNRIVPGWILCVKPQFIKFKPRTELSIWFTELLSRIASFDLTSSMSEAKCDQLSKVSYLYSAINDLFYNKNLISDNFSDIKTKVFSSVFSWLFKWMA